MIFVEKLDKIKDNGEVAYHRHLAGPRQRRGWLIFSSMYTVYILYSKKTKRHYIGFTIDLNDRLRRHNSGATISTRKGRPWIVVYKEQLSDKKSAWLRERQIKSYKGGEAFKKLINK